MTTEKLKLEGSQKKHKGPPNRMNDLAYRDWMKFQKSFFFYQSSQALVEECIYFFTKAIWPNGNPSRSLVLAFSDINVGPIPSPRIVEAPRNCKSIHDIIQVLDRKIESRNKYDFILIDFRAHIADKGKLSSFLKKHADGVFRKLRVLLYDQRYCGILVGSKRKGGAGFPIAWSVAMASRTHLRLRDEKIALMEGKNAIFYCLFFQANDDERLPTILRPTETHLTRERRNIPAWIIPKPPPRKKNEILHPAKYPETLISQFIELFSNPGDNILDPMVGTGSTVLAAIRTGRNGYGVDLVSDFVEIAENRTTLPLFSRLEGTPRSILLEGDATKLSEIPELKEIRFKYAITSPPYWSMLTNPGSEGQRSRRNKQLPLVYSHDERDLGNIQDYDQFLKKLLLVFNQVADKLMDSGYLTIVAKNVKRNHILYTLAWDLVTKLCGPSGKYNFLGATVWCQNDVGIKPFAVGIHWVSNTLHHYCLHFRKQMRPEKTNHARPSK